MKTTEKSTEVKKTKIVNLCEDMNPHEHDEDSYNKMIQIQDTL